MSPMLVPRLEAKDGCGPFTTTEKRPYNATRHLREMPTPWNDYREMPPETCADYSIYNCFRDNWYCGFFGPDKLAQWVTPDERKLFRGFYLKTYMVPPGCFKAGLEQVMFDKAAAVLVEEEWLGDAEPEQIEPNLIYDRPNDALGVPARSTGAADALDAYQFKIFTTYAAPTTRDPIGMCRPLFYQGDSPRGAQRGQSAAAGNPTGGKLRIDVEPSAGWRRFASNPTGAMVQRCAERIILGGGYLADWDCDRRD